MTTSFPPPPKNNNVSSVEWRDWLEKVRGSLTLGGVVSWSDINFTGSNITSILNRDHNDLTSKQGGTTNEFYHLTQANHSALSGTRITKGVDTTDDVIIDLATKGLVLKDTQGTPHYWRVTINTSGVLVTTDLGTTKP